PNVNIQQFIVDFVCDDQQAVDIRPMQENIRSYKSLEQEADVLQDKIALLAEIHEVFQRYTEATEGEMVYTYLIDRAAYALKGEELQDAESASVKLAGDLEDLRASISAAERRLAECRAQRDTLQIELHSDDSAHALEEIDRQIASKEQEIRRLQEEYDKARELLLMQTSQWRARTETLLDKTTNVQLDVVAVMLASRVVDISRDGQAFLQRLAGFSTIDESFIANIRNEDLPGLTKDGDRLKRQTIELAARIQEEQENLSRRREELLTEQRSLESGIYQFPQDAIDLKEALRSRLSSLAKEEVPVRIVAEMAEIKDDRWRNVIEGYLHTQKHYIIVPAEFFAEALRILNNVKRQRAVYGTGLVDVERIRERVNPSADKGSLAEELETEDPEVRLFLDFVLGRVRKSDRIQDLRKHHTAVTDEGMLYQNFVVRAINPERWARPAIGQGAIRRRLEAISQELRLLTAQAAAYSSLLVGFHAVRDIDMLSERDVEQILSSSVNLQEVVELQADLLSLRQSRQAIDTTKIDMLKARILVLEEQLSTLDEQVNADRKTEGAFEERALVLQHTTIPKLTAEQEGLGRALGVNFEAAWVETVGGPRFDREFASRKGASPIAAAFPRELSRERNAKADAWDSLIKQRMNYNSKHKMGYDVYLVENAVYDTVLAELRDNQLPEYQGRINDAKAKAFEQFQEDFISRLQNNIRTARRQIDELNSAIRGARFGEDLYSFRMIPKPENKRFYDMIVDEMITQGGYNLLSVQFNEKYKDEISDLFSIITNEEGAIAGGGQDYERRIQEFTDFSTYLSFDLEVVSHDGVSQRLSRTLGKKSGGETQTPFYVAVLASFAQLYRSNRDSSYRTSRLIIFDEAFSKMDGERIVQSIALLRQFDFQVILCAPPDKVGDIAPLVDRNLCAIREGTKAAVVYFDPKDAESGFLPLMEEYADADSV
ncbi:MAG: hypothetical protein FWH28_06535, partial [Clostridiales bacterium]|nr:hypothetical protein [Clostridiales bacterium]